MITQKDIGFYYLFFCGNLDEIIEEEIKKNEKLKCKKEKQRILNKRSFDVLVDNIEKHYAKEIDPNIVVGWFVNKFSLKTARRIIHYRILLEWKKANKK